MFSCRIKHIFQFRNTVSKYSGSHIFSNSPTFDGPVSLVVCMRHCQSNNSPPSNGQRTEFEEKRQVAPGWGKYKIFEDENAPVILDIEEERLKSYNYNEDEYEDEFQGINLERGIDGVYDIDELVELLKRENAQDVFVASLPPHFNYVNFIVVVTGKSQRHMKSMAEFVRKVFKKKMLAKDHIPKIEGENSKDWIAMDLGNIAVHIFSKKSRSVYDLESLWSVGSQFDVLCNKPEDPLVQLLERHSVYLGDLRPAETLG